LVLGLAAQPGSCHLLAQEEVTLVYPGLSEGKLGVNPDRP
jgi:hypothetical protein